MIVIEGPDLVGKTRLAKRLESMFEGGAFPPIPAMVYQHLSKPPVGLSALQLYSSLAGLHFIRDRFHISEPLYAKAAGRDAMFFPEEGRMVDAHLRVMGTLTIIVTCEDCLIEDRYAELKDREMFPLETVLRVNNYFHSLARKNGEWKDYKFDLDYHIHCDKAKPFPSRWDLEQIIESYTERRRLVASAF